MELINEIIDLLDEGKAGDVIDKVDSFLAANPEYKTIDYYHFANPIEQILYGLYIDDDESIKKLGYDEEPLDEIYQIYAMAYEAKGEMELAQKYLLIANQINPVSAIIKMRLCEFYQLVNEEHKIRDFALDIMKYTYDVDLLVASYFKLADYYYHMNQDIEIYDHVLNLFMVLHGEDMDVSGDIKYLEDRGFQVGFNPEVVQILLYLYDVHTEHGMKTTAQYFKNLLDQIVDFNDFINELR